MHRKYHQLWLYVLLSRYIPKSYKGKIMGIAFFGTHIPLIALLIYFIVISTWDWDITFRVLGVALIATLIGTAITLYSLHHLLSPIILTSLAQRAYLERKELPYLPIHYADEVGMLMADTVQTIRRLDEVIDHLRNYDSCTGLPNRVLFSDRLQQVLLKNKPEHQPFAVIFVKLHNHRDIQNALGTHRSEELLRTIAHQLTQHTQDKDIVARVSDDEFAIALPHLSSPHFSQQSSVEIIPFCQKLLQHFDAPIHLQNQTVNILVNLGISIYPLDGETIDQLLQNAQTAVDEAARVSINGYQFYAAQMNVQLQERLTLETQLRHALERQELQVYYQPRVESKTGEIVSIEALLRWHNPAIGMVSPAKFIPIAEANGLIIPIGEWVLKQACLQNKQWQKMGSTSLRIAVNLSARQLSQPNLVERIAMILKETELDPAYLELEVTESLIMQNVEQSIRVLNQLRNLGVKLALDDFGTGYSSLNYLRRFPIHTLKIDRSFVRDVAKNPHDAAVTNAIITLAKTLKLNITAEGVETKEQCAYIRAQGCDEIQGYYFSPPIPAPKMTRLLQDEKDALIHLISA